MSRQQLLTKKQRALQEFTQRVLKTPLHKDIFKIILFGSLVYGDWDSESDIDVLVFSKKRRQKWLQDQLSDISFDVMLDKGELVEPMVFGKKDYQSPQSSFLIEAIQDGKELYSA